MLGGQGGDEIFGGYARYLIAYFEQCIKAAIDGTMDSGNFVVTYESIIPNLAALRSYKPLLQEFWRDGLFDDLDAPLLPADQPRARPRRRDQLGAARRLLALRDASVEIFHGENVGKESYFDSMTHFDFKTLLPALLQVEDRMSMAHGLESRVPFLDHPLVEFAATIPSDVKFRDGAMKHVLQAGVRAARAAVDRRRARTRWAFPVPLQRVGDAARPVRDFVLDILSSDAARGRGLDRQRQGPRPVSTTEHRVRPQASGGCCPSSSGSRSSTIDARPLSQTAPGKRKEVFA